MSLGFSVGARVLQPLSKAREKAVGTSREVSLRAGQIHGPVVGRKSTIAADPHIDHLLVEERGAIRASFPAPHETAWAL
jgi:hypothetical protein